MYFLIYEIGGRQLAEKVEVQDPEDPNRAIPGSIEHAREQAAGVARRGVPRVIIVKSVAEVVPAVDFFVVDEEDDSLTRIDDDGLSVEQPEET